ncbi:MAG: fimbrillin family protein [Bacteroidales bacterium]|nr:fimbrillin family protein [Bacteroidales bacterium]MBR0083248.1 fimbrillin family protein [Bacteroidales bacterium]MBR0291897.1 fimbrillin family protein [Bacteroidales bacterium]
MRKLIYILLAVLILAGCQKYYLMIPPPQISDDELDDEDIGTSTRVDNIFVTVYGDGDMDGSSWDNAYDAAGLRTILTDKSDLSNTVIYLAEGKYIIGKGPGSGLLLKKDIKLIKGGYSSSSAGKDLAKRDYVRYESILSGDVNLNGKADDGDCAMFIVTGGNIAFEGVVFEGGYIDTEISAVNSVSGSNGSSSGAASVFGITGNPSSTVVDVEKCVFRGNVSTSAHNGSAQGKTSISGGPCAIVTSGFFRARGCTFSNNVAVNRGGAIRLMGAEAVCFLDKCFFSGNTLSGTSEGWGSSIQVSYGHLCVNNSTFIDNVGKGGDINGGGAFLLVNSTMFQTETDTYGAFRCESISGAGTRFINNVFTSRRSDGVGFNYSGDDRDITSAGFNLFQRIRGKDIHRADDVLWPAVLDGTLENGCWVWDATQVGRNADEQYATLDSILEAVKSFNPIITGDAGVANLGALFFQWVGETGFSEDKRGRPRNPQCLQKGSFDAYLTQATPSGLKIGTASVVAENMPVESFRMKITNKNNPSYSYLTTMMWNGEGWSSIDGISMMWDPELSPVDILAVSPAIDVDGIVPFSVASDQSSGTASSDLLVSKQKVDPKTDLNAGRLSLQFSHIMSRLCIRVSNRDFGSLNNATVNGTALSCECDFAKDNPSVIVGYNSAGAILAYNAGSEYQAVLVPQTTPSVLKVSITDNTGITYDWQSGSPVQFEAGESYVLTLVTAETKSGRGYASGSINKAYGQ